MSKNKYRSEKFEKKQKQIRVRKTILWSIVGILLLAGFIYWMNRESLKISVVQVSDLQFADEKKVQADVEEMLAGKYLGLISRRNALFIDRDDIAQKILERNIFIETARVSVKRFDVLQIDAVEFGAVAKWCGESTKKKLRECYLMNSNGNIFTKEVVINKEDVPVFYGPISQDYIIGKSFLDSDQFKNVIQFVEKLKTLNIFVRSVETSDFETIVIQTTAGPYIMISTLNDSQTVIENLGVVIETEEINKAQLSNLEYIDLRFTNKAFYKIK